MPQATRLLAIIALYVRAQLWRLPLDRRHAAVLLIPRAGLLGLLILAQSVRADELQVATAANFAAPMEQIATDFAKATGHKVVVIAGATGKLYAQIRNGAPYAVLLAADEQTPRKLEEEGLAVVGQRFTYAIGKLVLFSSTPGFVDAGGEVLKAGKFRHLALANPKTAPYGAAAVEALHALGQFEAVQSKVVEGESIGQTFSFVVSGNAELGFVALSQLGSGDSRVRGSWWLVPQSLYAPIRQDACLLTKGADQPAARAFLEYLRSENARALIRAHGYDL